jgi:hypothetical protein
MRPRAGRSIDGASDHSNPEAALLAKQPPRGADGRGSSHRTHIT